MRIELLAIAAVAVCFSVHEARGQEDGVVASDAYADDGAGGDAGITAPEGTDSYCEPGSRHRQDTRLLATEKTSTMERELNEGADAGYRLYAVMGGATSFGGDEVVSIMCRNGEVDPAPRYTYKLLATKKTSTMQKELQEASDAGFTVRGQTVFKTAFGGQEVVIIMEQDRDTQLPAREYRLLATKKTSTMQKEMREATEAGFEFVDLTVSKSTFGGDELVVIMWRAVDASAGEGR